MTGAALAAVLDRLRAEVLPPKLQSSKIRYRFRLDRGDSLDVVLDRGRLSVAESPEPPDCVVECTSEELEAVLSGRHNLLTTFMRGDARLLGTLAAAKSLYSYLRYAHVEESKG
jgi:putative sterol carrier protein